MSRVSVYYISVPLYQGQYLLEYLIIAQMQQLLKQRDNKA
jgi:hypothetical protein